MTLTSEKLIYLSFNSSLTFDFIDFLFLCYLSSIYLMGQSAGAHIAACALLELATIEYEHGESASSKVARIKAYFALSGGYVWCFIRNLMDFTTVYFVLQLW